MAFLFKYKCRFKFASETSGFFQIIWAGQVYALLPKTEMTPLTIGISQHYVEMFGRHRYFNCNGKSLQTKTDSEFDLTCFKKFKLNYIELLTFVTIQNELQLCPCVFLVAKVIQKSAIIKPTYRHLLSVYLLIQLRSESFFECNDLLLLLVYKSNILI